MAIRHISDKTIMKVFDILLGETGEFTMGELKLSI